MPILVRRRWEADPARMPPPGHALAFDYDAYVPDPLTAFAPAVPLDLAGAIEATTKVLTELQDTVVFGGLEALSRQLLRAESIGSSRLEGLSLSQRRLARAMIDPEAEKELARAVTGNIAAMDEAIRWGADHEEFRLPQLLAVHARLLEGTADAEIGGVLRTRQNWIGGQDWSPDKAEFIPPPEDLVESLLEDLLAFMGRTDLPAIVQAAVVHAQFETIHPFADGNGRVGRALIHTVLRRRVLTPRFVPPVSLVLATNASRYVEGLTAYRAGDVAGWCGFFVQALNAAAEHARILNASLMALQDRWRELLGRPRSHSAVERLIQVLPAHPVVNLQKAVELTNASEEAARRALVDMEAAGILSMVQVGKKRNRMWEARELLQILDSFEWELARPTRSGEPRRPSPGRH